MLIGQVPNTSLYIGMSRRQFGACQALAQAQHPERDEDDWMASEQTRTTFLDLSDNRIRQQIRSRDMAYLSFVQQEQRALETQTRRGFTTAQDASWQDLLRTPVQEINEPPEPVIESATEDTYLAINRRALGQ